MTSLVAATVLSTILAYFPMAHAHGVQAQLQSRFVRIGDESFSTQTMKTGDTLTVTGTLQSLVNRPLRAWLSLFSDSTNAGTRWEFISRDPPGNIFDIPAGASIPYSITVKALEPGTYHVHTQLNIEH
ncbi:MAG TPA: methane monooxygenase/ammonia monooxygenase subunit B, partial [Nitrososphaeraceae archaeon]